MQKRKDNKMDRLRERFRAKMVGLMDTVMMGGMDEG